MTVKTWLWGNAVYGTIATMASVGAASISVSNAQGTFPTPTVAASQGFTVVANPNVSSLTQNPTTEYLTVTTVAPGSPNVFGLESPTTQVHQPGENVVLVITSESSYPGPGSVSAVASVGPGDASIVVGGTQTNPTIETGTLDVIANLHSPAANWSNNSKKITSLANGTLATDAAAFGQIPTAASVIGGVMDVVANDTAIVVGGNAASVTVSTGTLDVIATNHPPAANWSNNSHKITSLANGAASSDAAAFGQIPTSASVIGGVMDVVANDTAIVIGGNAASVTVSTGTLDVIATNHPPAANWSNNNHKITSLSNGTTATDAAAFGQIPTAASVIGGVMDVVALDGSISIGGNAASVTVATGTLDVIATDHPAAADWSNNSHKITSLAAGISSTDAVNVSQLPAAVPPVSALNAWGHSYLGAINLGIPETQLQFQGLMSKILGQFHTPETSFDGIITAGGTIIQPNGAALSGWDAVFQRKLPAGAIGMAGYAVPTTSSVATYVLPGQTNPSWPNAGQSPTVVLHGVNDMNYGFASTFSGSISGAASGSVTSSTNLSSSGSFLSGRVGGTGLHVGDWLQGNGIRGDAQVASVGWNGSITTILLNNGNQTTAAESAQTYTVLSGDTTQFRNALKRAFVAGMERFMAGATVRSDDAAITYPTNVGWSTSSATSPFTGRTGPTYRTTSTNNDQFSYTLPANFPGGWVSVVMVGTSDLDSSGCSVSWASSSSSFSGVATTTIGGTGWTGYQVPVIASALMTAADAGKTIVGTFSVGSGGSPALILDHISIAGTWTSPVLLMTQPPGIALTQSRIPMVTALNGAVSDAVSYFTGRTAASVCGVINTFSQVAQVDLATLISKRSFYLGTSLSTAGQGTSTANVTIYGQRTTAQNDQVTPYAGQLLFLPSSDSGDHGEVALITAVAATSNVTVGGNTYPAWIVTTTRAYVFGNANLLSAAGIANTGHTSGSTLGQSMYDVTWCGPDITHPGVGGAVLFSSAVVSQYTAVANTSSDFIAACNAAPVQNRSRTAPRPFNGGYLTPRGTPSTNNALKNTGWAWRKVLVEPTIVYGLQVNVTAAGTGCVMYGGIWIPENSGSQPGTLIYDFGLAGHTLSGTGLQGVTGYIVLPPGEYWFHTAFGNVGTTGTVESITNNQSDIDLPLPSGPTLSAQVLGYNGAPGTPTSLANTTWAPYTGGNMVRPYVQVLSHSYGEFG